MDRVGSDHDIGSAALPPASLVQHRRRRATATRIAKVNAQHRAPPSFGRDLAQELRGIGAPFVLVAHLANLAITWTSASGRPSMIRSTTFGRRRAFQPLSRGSPTTTWSEPASRAAWMI